MVARPDPTARHLSARSIDAVARDLLSSPTEWRVHSVFERAANLRSDVGDLLGLAMSPAPNAPATVVLDGWPKGQALSSFVTPGEAALVSDGHLVIEDRLPIDLRPAALWAPPPIVRTAPAPVVLDRIRDAQEVAGRYAPNGGLAPLLPGLDDLVAPAASPRRPLPQAGDEERQGGSLLGAVGRERRGPQGGDLLIVRASEGIERLAAGWRAADAEAIGEGAHLLSGLGPGLTPSGDDLLAGFGLGIRAASGAFSVDLTIAIEDAVAGRTSDLAVARIQHALAGRADEYVDAVLRALVSDGAPDLSASVVTLLGYGHTSGVDTLVGLLLGVRLGL